MAYRHEQYGYPMGQNQHNGVFYHPQLQQAAYSQQPMHNEMIYNTYPGYGDSYETFAPGFYAEDYDDNSEVTTRPRLTKDQVDALEDEFQKNPKPNSQHKRGLAMVTGLSHNRVANWFQNRRAKAKQQRKLEEYEHSQQQESPSRPSNRRLAQSITVEDNEDSVEEEACRRTARSAPVIEHSEAVHNPHQHHTETGAYHDVRDKSWASLQRALAAARAAQIPREPKIQSQLYDDQMLSMPPPPQQRVSPLSHELVHPQPQHQLFNMVQNGTAHATWASPPLASGDMAFDFGFETSEIQPQHSNVALPSPTDSGSQSTVLSPEVWDSTMNTPTMPPPHHQLPQALQSPGLPTPTYSGSRRGSLADTLTNNFEGFAIANGVAQTDMPGSAPAAYYTSEGGIDLASRRRRPRPPALISTALRSRSSGALTATSPTFRTGICSSSAQPLRHVKSTGHSLNSHYSGVRKASATAKSPLNVATFAEAEFQAMLAQTASENNMKQQLTPVNTAFQTMQAQPPAPPMPHRSHMQSPPITPFQPQFMPTNSMPPPSIQYASCADYTPPYSAGPLTNSSWSDAPLTSPELFNFPQVNFIPTLMGDMSHDEQIHVPWTFASDQSPGPGVNAANNDKQTQFYIQEFPNQAEEHAQAAQHLNQSRPKHYAFQHHKPEDFVSHS